MSKMAPDAVPRVCCFSAFRLYLLAGFYLTSPAIHAQERAVNPALQNRSKATFVQSRAECTCRAMGADFVVGTEACINNTRMRCVMEQNVTSWKRMDDGCPQS